MAEDPDAPKLGVAQTVVLDGMEGVMVDVECSVAGGVPFVKVVGLPDASINESCDRVRAALESNGIRWKSQRTIFNLSPAHVRKRGTGCDLAMAAALLCGKGVLTQEQLTGTVLLGELGLDGRLHGVRGALPSLLAAATHGARRFVLPRDNRAEATIPLGDSVQMQVWCADTLGDVLAFLRGDDNDLECVRPALAADYPPVPDLAEVRGQPLGRRALEIAAAGGHHLFFKGPPGAGKTMLARRLPGILPPLSDEDALSVTSIHSLCGMVDPDHPLHRFAPFEAPHHSATAPSIVGGGSGIVRPGAASRAHRGVLFLDEAPEFAQRVLDQLRQPLEAGTITIHRSIGAFTFPARFQLVMAANPCPCASAGGAAACVCSSIVRRRYLGRLSGPLLDRIDLAIELAPPTRSQLLNHAAVEETSAVVAARVREARERAQYRWDGRLNGEVSGKFMQARWQPSGTSLQLVERAYDVGAISGRGYDRVLRVAWTIADLAGRGEPSSSDVAEALGFRQRSIGQVA